MFILILSVLLCGAVSVHSQEKCVKPPRIDPTTCCDSPDLIAASVMDSCKAKYPMPEMSTESADAAGEEKKGKGGKFGKRHGHFNKCVEECAFNETAINVNGNIDRAVLTTKFSTAVASVPAFTPIVTAAINSCFTEMEEMKARWAGKEGKHGPRPDSGNEKKCGHESGMLLHCIQKELVKNCPADKEVKSDDCTQLKAFFASDCKFGKHH